MTPEQTGNKPLPDRRWTMADIRSRHTGPFFDNCKASGAKILSGVYQGNGGIFFVTREPNERSHDSTLASWPVFNIWQYLPDRSGIRYVGKSSGTDMATVRQSARDWARLRSRSLQAKGKA